MTIMRSISKTERVISELECGVCQKPALFYTSDRDMRTVSRDPAIPPPEASLRQSGAGSRYITPPQKIVRAPNHIATLPILYSFDRDGE